MELVYLWVEEYKNIKRQGFNFSPNYDVEFKPVYENKKLLESTKLIVENKVNYLDDFFGKNINITAIVGENGVGKSNLIILLISSLFQNKNNYREISDIFILYNIDDELVLYTNSTISLVSNCKIESNIITPNSYSDKYLKKTYQILMDFSIGQIDFFNDEKDYKVNYALEPSRLYKSSGGAGMLTKIEPASFDANMRVNALYLYYFIYKNKLDYILKDFNIPIFKTLEYVSASQKSVKLKEETFSRIKSENIFGIEFNQFNEYRDVVNYFRSEKFIINIKDINEEDLIKVEDLLVLLNLEVFSSDNLYFYCMSTGQQTLLSYIGIIIRSYLHLEGREKNTFNIYIDEFENSLHPNWQKFFLYFIVNMIKKLGINEKYKINMIISTHSPFLLSDFPKENVIFLKKDENNCINSSHNITIDSFGANVHTLLTDLFYGGRPCWRICKRKNK